MLNLNAMNAIADNEIRINNVVVGHLTDADAQRIWDIVRGMQGQVSTPKQGLVFEEDQKPTKKAEPPKDYEVVLEGKDNAVWFTANAQDVRQAVNAQLKAVGFKWDGDVERPDTYKRDYTGKDGVTHKVGEHKKGAWTLMRGTKRDIATAKQWIGKTITVTAQERQTIRDGWEARKNRKERA